jgi:hypothetical protein
MVYSLYMVPAIPSRIHPGVYGGFWVLGLEEVCQALCCLCGLVALLRRVCVSHKLEFNYVDFCGA